MPQPVFRFAPSPNGALHLGHALSALLDHALARACGGRFLLRLEDVDPTRCRPEFERAILDDLAWLGLDWDGEVRRQSEHLAEHRAALARLEAEGLVYPSRVTRGALKALVAAAEAAGTPWPHDPDGAPWPPPRGAPFATVDGEPPALRLDTAAALARSGPLDWIETGGETPGVARRVTADPAAWGDPILARKEMPSSYHLAVVVDDAAQGVTHVVRGADLYRATDVHRLLQDRLGLPAPIYHHHELIRDGQGRKLSKSASDTALAALRADGATPDDVRALIDWPAREADIPRLSRVLRDAR
ncbi:tRNA glutamyl-Q(34) synthetase GluQRS [Siculibacillus lacustris]|uniref:tRNA glutamyl-Q(34) synthetase GluQRS n=1 Tax=Siculibacillus lacustris TaxID=1549641 RepID=A0A4Q9VLA9_9HYPH|nr:tRNA glutamyl-Q(34) synthetase GluQRS [Siculibacillus lacustris]TBW36253.1 tRNA glutamyl-Q(34) synthetase GluQRS [Siculibacillus lacustris]